jgi:hypothetical protein
MTVLSNQRRSLSRVCCAGCVRTMPRPVQTDWETVLAKVAEKLIAAKKLKA